MCRCTGRSALVDHQHIYLVVVKQAKGVIGIDFFTGQHHSHRRRSADLLVLDHQFAARYFGHGKTGLFNLLNDDINGGDRDPGGHLVNLFTDGIISLFRLLRQLFRLLLMVGLVSGMIALCIAHNAIQTLNQHGLEVRIDRISIRNPFAILILHIFQKGAHCGRESNQRFFPFT